MLNNRRKFLYRMGGLAAASAAPAWIPAAHAAVIGNHFQFGGASDPRLVQVATPKFFTRPLPNPLANLMKPTSGTTGYTVTATQINADILGVPGFTTTAWGYQSGTNAATYPGPTFLVTKGTPITVTWVNGLVDAASKPLPHLMPVDQTITTVNPISGVPLAVHHHGGENAAEFDGTPNQWATPKRVEIGPGITLSTQQKTAGALTAVYDNTQEASLHWYHDHAESITGLNVNAGLAGLYVVTDPNEAALRTSQKIPLPADEIAMVLQDRSFDARGQLTYQMNPQNVPYLLPPGFPVNTPAHLPEYFGDVMVVNGVAWPFMAVTRRKYRVRLLNGSDSRFFQLTFSDASVVAWVIGNDQGFLNTPVPFPTVPQVVGNLPGLLIAPGERYDLVVDFTAVPAGVTAVTLQNTAPTPFPGGGVPGTGVIPVMRFNLSATATKAPVVNLTATTALRPSTALLPNVATLTPPTTVRRILLAEGKDAYQRPLPMLGVYDPTGAKNVGTLSFQEPATETPTLNSTETWEFWNTTGDAHPMHMHLVKFRILNRQKFTGESLTTRPMLNGASGFILNPGSPVLDAAIQSPSAWESGWKDTVVCPPNQVTRIIVNFPRRGKYVYHCHILSHEDHDMMRWYQVI